MYFPVCWEDPRSAKSGYATACANECRSRDYAATHGSNAGTVAIKPSSRFRRRQLSSIWVALTIWTPLGRICCGCLFATRSRWGNGPASGETGSGPSCHQQSPWAHKGSLSRWHRALQTAPTPSALCGRLPRTGRWLGYAKRFARKGAISIVGRRPAMRSARTIPVMPDDAIPT
jgi:hypothetical protein